jgi:hypothetical protein
MFHGATIRPNLAKINNGGRRKIRIPMIMDEIKDQISRITSHGRERSRRR